MVQLVANTFNLHQIPIMPDVATLSIPASRFSNRVANYVKYRPGYPSTIVPFLEKELYLSPGHVVADIGAGTGLFAERLLEKGYVVTGVEPNAEMRKAAAMQLSRYSSFEILDGTAEATGLPDESVDLVTVAQAFHWFDPVVTRIEFNRILRPGGKIVLAWNILKASNSFLEAYMALKRDFRITDAVPGRDDAAQVNNFFGNDGFQKYIFPNNQFLDFDGLKGQLLSTSYIPLPGHPQYETMMATLIELFVAHNRHGFVEMEYETMVYCGR